MGATWCVNRSGLKSLKLLFTSIYQMKEFIFVLLDFLVKFRAPIDIDFNHRDQESVHFTPTQHMDELS